MKANEIRDFNDQQLAEFITEQRSLLGNLKYNHALSPIENPGRINTIRKDVARALTIQSERTSAANQAA